MGIKDFLTGSDGKRYTSMFYKQNAKKLAKAQRDYSRKVFNVEEVPDWKPIEIRKMGKSW